jgi:hypothetical protein
MRPKHAHSVGRHDSRPPNFKFFLLALAGIFIAITPQAARATAFNAHTASDLTMMLHQAQPGDEIVLDAGATYVGNFTLETKTGDDYHPRLVRAATRTQVASTSGSRSSTSSTATTYRPRW